MLLKTRSLRTLRFCMEQSLAWYHKSWIYNLLKFKTKVLQTQNVELSIQYICETDLLNQTLKIFALTFYPENLRNHKKDVLFVIFRLKSHKRIMFSGFFKNSDQPTIQSPTTDLSTNRWPTDSKHSQVYILHKIQS